MSKQSETKTTALGPYEAAEREITLLGAAEDVLSRWSIIRASDGKLGSCGLPEAFKALEAACEAYTCEESADAE